MRTWVKVALGVAISSVAISPSWLIGRLFVPYMMYQNAPSRLPNISVFSEQKIKFEDQIRNCEDAVLDENLGIAYFSCDPGRDRWNTVMGISTDPDWREGGIYYLTYASSKPNLHRLPITNWEHQPATFHPLGIGYSASNQTLYIVNLSAAGPSIELLALSSSGTSATHVATLRHTLIATPNSVTPLGNDALLFTNDHRFTAAENKLLSTAETWGAYPGGSVVLYNVTSNAARKLAHVPFANGVAVLNSSHVAVASTVMPALLIYELDAAHGTMALRQTIKATFCVDNLKMDSRGKLLVAGHPNPFEFETVAATNHRYNYDGEVADAAALLPLEKRPRAPSWVAEWDGNGEGRMEKLYVGYEYGTSTTAVRDAKRGIGFLVGLYDRGIVQWKE